MAGREYRVWIPPEIERIILKLKGRRLGIARVVEQLEIDPCSLRAYRLQGILQPKLCGYHLRDGWRITFTFLDEDPEGQPGTVAVIYVGEKEPTAPRSLGPMWQVVHQLLDVDYESGTVDRQECCEDEEGRPERPLVSEDEVLDAMNRLRQLEKIARRQRRD